MKLSTIWYKANRELNQVRGEMGCRSTKTACAFGAIYYFDAKDKSIETLRSYNLRDMNQSKYLVNALHRFRFAVGDDIVYLNDEKRWSFLDFARKARELRV